MKKFMTALMVLSLVLGGVALAAAAHLPQAPKTVGLNGLQKITDQEAQEIRGTGVAFDIQSVTITSALQPRTQSQTQTSYDISPVGAQQCPRDRTQSNWN